jgi:hypothetical protein
MDLAELQQDRLRRASHGCSHVSTVLDELLVATQLALALRLRTIEGGKIPT